MQYRFHLNPFQESWECAKCGNEIEMSLRYCEGDPVKQPEITHGFEAILLPKSEKGEKPYCSLFVIEHLHVTCDRCGYSWHSATADSSPARVQRINLLLVQRRKRLKEIQWPEVI